MKFNTILIIKENKTLDTLVGLEQLKLNTVFDLIVSKINVSRAKKYYNVHSFIFIIGLVW